LVAYIPGECTQAVKHLPLEMTKAEKSVEWRKIAGMRDVLAHEYFGVDEAIIGDVVEKKLEGLDRTARRLLSDKGPSVREKAAPYAVKKTLKRLKIRKRRDVKVGIVGSHCSLGYKRG